MADIDDVDRHIGRRTEVHMTRPPRAASWRDSRHGATLEELAAMDASGAGGGSVEALVAGPPARPGGGRPSTPKKRVRRSSRPSFDNTVFEVVAAFQKRATCTRLHTACAVVDQDNQILVISHNGAPRGHPHCDEVGCRLDAVGRCVRAIHAEQNAILQAARVGTSLLGATIYCSHRPCDRCASLLVQVGIVGVVYLEDYDSDESRAEVLAVLAQSGVVVRRHHVTVNRRRTSADV